MHDPDSDDRDIERLLTAVGKRAEPPVEMRARVHAAVLKEWDVLPEPAARRSVWTARFAMAASVIGALMLGLWWNATGTGGGGAVGEVVFASGPFLIDGIEHNGQDRAAFIIAGGRLETASGATLTAELTSGVRMTFDQNTDVRMSSADEVRVERGRVYVDAAGSAQVTLHTPHARLLDIGTVYEAQVDASTTVVRVREGRVELNGPDGPMDLAVRDGRGDVVRLAEGRGAERSTIASNDAHWAWRAVARPPFHLAGSTVYDYLQWMARDQGHELAFAGAAVEQQARLARLAGSADLTSDGIGLSEALQATDLVVQDPAAQRWTVDFRR